MSKVVNLVVQVDPELRDTIKKLADAEERTMKVFVTRILTKALKDMERVA